MLGVNSLVLNEATMQEALQVWLDGKIPDGAPEVTAVNLDDRPTGQKLFRVTLTERKGKTDGKR